MEPVTTPAPSQDVIGPPTDGAQAWIRTCDVCFLANRDPTPKPCSYCELCKAWMCDECRVTWSLRGIAVLKSLWASIATGLFHSRPMVREVPAPAAPPAPPIEEFLVSDVQEEEPPSPDPEDEDEELVFTQPDPIPVSKELAFVNSIQPASPVLVGLAEQAGTKVPGATPARLGGAFKPTRRRGVLVPRE